MTMTLDEVPAKLNELDLRVPLEVFDAIDAAIHERADLWSKWQAERCFRAKAESELATLKARLKPRAQVVGGKVRVFMDPDDERKYVAVLVVEE